MVNSAPSTVGVATGVGEEVSGKDPRTEDAYSLREDKAPPQGAPRAEAMGAQALGEEMPTGGSPPVSQRQVQALAWWGWVFEQTVMVRAKPDLGNHPNAETPARASPSLLCGKDRCVNIPLEEAAASHADSTRLFTSRRPAQ